MTLPREHAFTTSRRGLRPGLAALGITIAAALALFALDLQTSASAAGLMNETTAVQSARAQGFEGTDVEAKSRYDRVTRRVVWDIRSAEGERAVVDAISGDLVSLDF